VTLPQLYRSDFKGRLIYWTSHHTLEIAVIVLVTVLPLSIGIAALLPQWLWNDRMKKARGERATQPSSQVQQEQWEGTAAMSYIPHRHFLAKPPQRENNGNE
jgi:hypothetical protein